MYICKLICDLFRDIRGGFSRARVFYDRQRSATKEESRLALSTFVERSWLATPVDNQQMTTLAGVAFPKYLY